MASAKKLATAVGKLGTAGVKLDATLGEFMEALEDGVTPAKLYKLASKFDKAVDKFQHILGAVNEQLDSVLVEAEEAEDEPEEEEELD